jgi:hypothetical protein
MDVSSKIWMHQRSGHNAGICFMVGIQGYMVGYKDVYKEGLKNQICTLSRLRCTTFLYIDLLKLLT